MSFTSSSLSISQYCCIITFKHRQHTLFCSIFVNELLSGPFIINVIESKALPYAKVLIHLNIFLPLFFGDLSAKVLHDAARLIFWAYIHDWSKLAALDHLSFQRWPDPDNHPEVITWGLWAKALRLGGVDYPTSLALANVWILGRVDNRVIWLIQKSWHLSRSVPIKYSKLRNCHNQYKRKVCLTKWKDSYHCDCWKS